MEWRPIETAPKDGTAFIGYNPKYGWVGTVRFDLEATVTCTHWMPLPEPPKPFSEYGDYGENNPPVMSSPSEKDYSC